MPRTEKRPLGHQKFGRRCFVTVGATASFYSLLAEVLSTDFLDFLTVRGFDELLVQTGPDQAKVEGVVAELARLEQADAQKEKKQHKAKWPAIQAFTYTTDMVATLRPCRGEVGERLPGVMISHAGSGSILDAARLDVPLVVVPNGSLLGNHQEELADAVEEAGWAVKGTLGHLQEAVDRTVEAADLDLLAGRQQAETDVFPTPEGERSGLFDWAATARQGSLAGMQLD